MLGYVLNQLDGVGYIELSFVNIDWGATLLAGSAITTFFSLICGSFTLLSRLYDLRLIRHVATVRIKAFKKSISVIHDNERYIDLRDNSNYLAYAVILMRNFVGTLTMSKYFMRDNEINGNEGKEKFIELRKRTLMLGSFSWMNFGWQIVWLSFGVVCYTISWLIAP